MLKRGILLIPILGICLETIIDAHAQGKNNLQFWNSEGIEIQLNRRWKTGVREELRFKINDGSLYHYFSEIELKYILNENLEFSVEYRNINEKKLDNWRREYRPHINGTFKLLWQNFMIEDRSRWEFRIPEGGNQTQQYRNRLSLSLPFHWTRLGIQPYIVAEMFFDLDKKTINRNRLYWGLRAKFLRRFKGEVAYMLQSTKNIEWTDIHVLVTNLKYSF